MLTTQELADAIGVRPNTIRVSLCQKGHYFGLRPHKLPNRFLMWPEDSVERLLATRLNERAVARCKDSHPTA